MLACACAGEAPPNLVLITLDTTRADHLGPYGYAQARTPALDAFAARAVLYERAYATSSWTLPSHASLFTGLLPMQHGAQTAPAGPVETLGYPVRPLAEHFETLAERLRRAGYRTGGVAGGPALSRELGVAQGFERYRDELRGPGELYAGMRAERVADLAIAQLRSFGAEPFFLFVNFFDPHAPYRPPPPHDRGLPELEEPRLAPALVTRLEAGRAPQPPAALEAWERRALDALRRGYDAEIAYLDLHLDRLLRALEAAPRGGQTLVAITSDHGESFGEHFFLSHGAHLYEDNVRVPLIVRRPGVDPARVAGPVQNHRLFATLLAAAGLEPPEGVALRPLDGEPAPIVTEVRRSAANVRLFGPFFDRDLRALYDPPYKWVESSGGTRELFDLESDPEELRNLAERDAARARELDARLARIAADRAPRYEPQERARLDPDTEEALRALGYLEREEEPENGAPERGGD